jgi:hypothetical protein
MSLKVGDKRVALHSSGVQVSFCSIAVMLCLMSFGCQSTSTADSNLSVVKFAEVSRAAKALEAGIGVGVTNAKFHDLIQNLYTEIYVARDIASTDGEKTLLKQYGDASEVYLDSLRLWDKQQKDGIWVCAADVAKGAETISECAKDDPQSLVSIAQKYNLPITIHTLKLSSYPKTMVNGTIPASSVQHLWNIGSQKLAACNLALNTNRRN